MAFRSKAPGEAMARRGRETWTAFALAGWAIACAAGFGTMWTYANTPGDRGGPDGDWVAPAALNLASDRFTIVLFAHPRCPCTRATMSELEGLQRAFPEQFATRIVFYEPHNADASWRTTSLWTRAERLPDAEAFADPGGRLTANAGALVSGSVALLGPEGTLQFWGGITPGRGHEGESIGLISIRDVLQGRQPARRTAHVYGCELVCVDAAGPCEAEEDCHAGH